MKQKNLNLYFESLASAAESIFEAAVRDGAGLSFFSGVSVNPWWLTALLPATELLPISLLLSVAARRRRLGAIEERWLPMVADRAIVDCALRLRGLLGLGGGSECMFELEPGIGKACRRLSPTLDRIQFTKLSNLWTTNLCEHKFWIVRSL